MSEKKIPSKRIQRARSEMSHRRTSMDSVRTDLRKKFLENIRLTRSRSVDRLRPIAEQYNVEKDYTSLCELRDSLLAEQAEADEIISDEVTDLLREVEKELQQVSLEYQVDKQASSGQLETDDAVNRLLVKCEVCQAMSVEKICSQCNAELNSQMTEV